MKIGEHELNFSVVHEVVKSYEKPLKPINRFIFSIFTDDHACLFEKFDTPEELLSIINELIRELEKIGDWVMRIKKKED